MKKLIEKHEIINIYVIESDNFYTKYTNGYIKNRTINMSKGDTITNDKGIISITLKDVVESWHNGDWSDEHIYGFETYELAKKALIHIIKNKINNLKTEIKTIKKLKEPKIMKEYYEK